jgi:glyoxylase-like metal-dependent hydrolase (beta-lactamase superfamily II)
MLVGQGGNIGLSVGDDGAFLVDDQYAPLTDRIQAAVAALTEAPVRFVVNTHWHGDHTGGNENLGKGGALIVAHDNVRKRLASDQFIEAFNREFPASPKVALPVVTFNDTVTFHVNGQTVQAFHVEPAHTDGDSAVWFQEADVLHTGDLFFNGFYPFIDVGSGGSVDGMIAAADRLLGMIGEHTKLIPGHGPAGNRADYVAFRDMLEGVRDAVAPLVAAGKSLEEVQAANPLAPFDETWGQGFLNSETFTGIVYASLKKTGTGQP